MNITLEQLSTAFTARYSPYLLKGFSFPERKPEDVLIDENHPELYAIARSVDLKKKEDPFIGAKLAGQEIYLNLTNWLKSEKGVHIETLLAVLGSVGGRECVNGIMNTFQSIVDDNSSDKSMEKAVAGLLNILIVETTNGEQYIMGDRIGNAFSSFYETAASENGIALNKLTKLASEVASKIGTESYWATSFGEFVKENPKELADLFDGKFEKTFNIYCCFPHERMLGFALAAQKAVKQAESVISKETALSILAEFGWRTAHYLE